MVYTFIVDDMARRLDELEASLTVASDTTTAKWEVVVPSWRNIIIEGEALRSLWGSSGVQWCFWSISCVGLDTTIWCYCCITSFAFAYCRLHYAYGKSFLYLSGGFDFLPFGLIMRQWLIRRNNMPDQCLPGAISPRDMVAGMPSIFS